MNNCICLNDKYSTTRCLQKKYLEQNKHSTFYGLRSQGYSKKSYQKNPLFSIITVVYNGENEIRSTIESVIHQDYDNIEYVIIDGNSSDRTLEIVKEYDNYIDYFISEPDKGIYDAMNKGISIINEKRSYIQLLNCGDTLFSKSTISELAKCMNESSDVIYGDYYVVDRFKRKKKIRSTTDYWSHMSISHQALFVKKSVYDQIGAYDTSYRICADYDLLIRLFESKIKFSKVENPVILYDTEGTSAQLLPQTYKESNAIHFKYFDANHLYRIEFLWRMYKNLFKFYIKKLIR